MRILIIHCAYKNAGGECTVVREEAELLRAAGKRVKLLEFNNKEHSLLKLLQLPFNLGSYMRTLRAIRSFKPDVVHVHNIHFGASASVLYAIKLMRLPVIVTLHNYRLLCPSATLFFDGQLFLNSLHERFSWSAVKKGVYQGSSLLTFWLAASTYMHGKLGTWRKVDRYIVLSTSGKRLFEQSPLRFRRDQLVVKPNFCKPPVLYPAARKEHFLFAGRLSAEKGIELLLSAFAGSNFQLRIAGDGPLQEKVMAYAAQYPNIAYMGVLSKEMIFYELQLCSALVFTSNWYEGMPLTIIESFSCGTPVIAANMGAMQTMIRHEFNGLHFEPQQRDDFELQLNRWFYMEEAEKARFTLNAFETYGTLYTPEKNLRQLLSIYKSAISQPAIAV